MGDFIRSIDGVFDLSERYRQMVSTHVGEQLTTNLLHAIAHVTPAQLQTLAQSSLTDLVTVVVGSQSM
jgi:predicted Zn-dependent peptidase